MTLGFLHDFRECSQIIGSKKSFENNFILSNQKLKVKRILIFFMIFLFSFRFLWHDFKKTILLQEKYKIKR